MPFGNLRRKSSSNNVRRRSIFQAQPRPETPTPLPAPDAAPKLSSSGALPFSSDQEPSSRVANAEKPRPSIASRPSSRLSSNRPSFKTRYVSDPQLNTSYRDHAANPPPSPPSEAAPAPTIGISSPSRDQLDAPTPRKRKFRPFANTLSFRASSYNGFDHPGGRSSDVQGAPRPETQSSIWGERPSTSTVDTNHGAASNFTNASGYLVPRHSESSTPMRTSGEKSPMMLDAGSRKSSFFRLKRKKPEPLFPLPIRVSPPKPASTASSSSPKHRYSSIDLPPPVPAVDGQGDSPTTMYSIAPPKLGRRGSSSSARSARSSPPITRPSGTNMRSRSGTMNSFPGRHDLERGPTPFAQGSGRNSASTTLGRNSFVGIRSLTSRLRNPSDPYVARHGSPGSGMPGVSGSNSFAMSRETLVVPQREDGETSGKYYSRLEKDLPKRDIALALSKSSDAFSHDALRSLARTFKFYEEPVDMSLRKFLWEVPLTGEAQQIDRVLSAFSERYHECNPHIFSSADEANYVSFSLIILHSDLFNPSVKNKMQRAQYQRNTRDVGIPNEILGYFYDNIAYTEFISEDADEDDGERKSKSAYRKARKVKQRLADPSAPKSDKLDPYEVILDEKMKIDNLRPSLKEELSFEDTYTYLGSANRFDIPHLRSCFARYGILQIVSARSRPEAFSSPSTIDNPSEAQAGVVPIKVAKLGILWRKSPKKKKTRSPWQEWGAILTASQLYLCRNATWVKGLAQQVEAHQKNGNRSTAVIFKPPLTEFAYEGKVNTGDAVALQDTNYRRHKYGFVLARRPNVLDGANQEQYFEETMLAENETEMNDWIAKLNYAATFRSTNVRMHSWSAAVQRQPSNKSSMASGPTFGEPLVEKNLRATSEILARTQAAKNKLIAAEDELTTKMKKLEDHIRIARHLEILAPFMPKTRGELLSFGARLAHNIRWSRFDVARLKCQRDILFRDVQEDESTTSTYSTKQDRARLPQDRFSSQSDKSKPRLGIVTGSLPIPGQAVVAEQNGSSRQQYEGADLVDSIDEAFATPPETMDRFDQPQSGQLKLLPVNIPPGTPVIIDSPSEPRRNSLPAITDQQRPRSADSATTAQSVPYPERRPASITESDMEAIPSSFASPDSRNSKVRRSLQRTLREPRDSHGSQTSRSSRSKKAKDKVDLTTSISGEDVASPVDAEGLARRPGSFKVHGKKASVITLGNEWQQVSAEERLRLRKMALSHEGSENRNSYVGTASIAEESAVADLDGSVADDVDDSAMIGDDESFAPAEEQQQQHTNEAE